MQIFDSKRREFIQKEYHSRQLQFVRRRQTSKGRKLSWAEMNFSHQFSAYCTELQFYITLVWTFWLNLALDFSVGASLRVVYIQPYTLHYHKLESCSTQGVQQYNWCTFRDWSTSVLVPVVSQPFLGVICLSCFRLLFLLIFLICYFWQGFVKLIAALFCFNFMADVKYS